MIIGVFYIDFEHAKDIFQICKWLQGSMEKNMIFAPASMVFRGKRRNPKFRVPRVECEQSKVEYG